jgi:hypothetical protein
MRATLKMVVGKMQTINSTEMPISILVRLSSLGDNSLADDDVAKKIN